MSEVERLHKRLVEAGVRRFNVFPGTGPTTPEKVAEAVNKVLDEIDREFPVIEHEGIGGF